MAVESVKPAIATLHPRDYCAESKEKTKEEKVTKESKDFLCGDKRIEVGKLGLS